MMSTVEKEWLAEVGVIINEEKKDCLKCRKSFLSEGNHNRICPACQEENEMDWDMGSRFQIDFSVIQSVWWLKNLYKSLVLEDI